MSRKNLNPRQTVLENLETRQLLSQISVTSFGAAPNDGRDDRSAIQAAVNASSPGDTIFFPSGTYNLSDEIMLKGGGRTYKGDSNTLLQGDRYHHIFHISEDNTRVENFTLDGKPFMVDTRNNAMVAGMVINNNTMRIHASGSDNNGITFTTGLRNSSITNNTFDPIDGDNGIYGYYWDNLTIANNELKNGNEGIHVIDHSNNSRNLLMEQNYFAGLHRMGVEYQGGGYNTILQDNWYEKPSLTSNFNDNNETFAYSIIATESNGTIARRNVIIAPERPDRVGCRIGYEIGGLNALIEDNYTSGVNHVVAANGFPGRTSVLVRNNFWENILQGPVGAGLTQYNNGPGVRLTWGLDRGKPGRNHRFGDPNPAPNPDPGPGPSPTPLPQGQSYLSDLGYSVNSNGWGAAEKDRSNGEAGSSDGRTLSVGGKTYAKGIGVHAASEISFNLGGKYKQFLSDVGVDDEVGSNGSVNFQVWLDNAKVYDSGRVTGAHAAQQVDVNLTGKSTMKLVVTDGGDGNGHDHADWLNSRLVAGTGTPNPDPGPGPSPTPLPQGQSYLSDLGYSVNSNGWGAAEKDRSNGEAGSSDGRTLSVGGKTYAKGIGVHAASEISFNLGGKYKQFLSDVGVDDEVGSNGSVNFQVWLDNAKVYDSGRVTGAHAAQQVDVNLTGKSTMKLVVTDGGDGNGHDHADWLNSRLVAADGTPNPSPNPEGPVNVSDLNWTSAVSAWGPVEKDRSNGEAAGGDGRTMAIRGSTYTKGLGVHANSDIRYDIAGQYKTFNSDIGIDNETGGNGSVIFQIWLDGKLAFDSGVVTGTDAVKQAAVDVTGARELRLVVNYAGGGNAYDHADWAGAKLGT